MPRTSTTQTTSPRRPRRVRGRILAATALTATALTALTGIVAAGMPAASADAATGAAARGKVVQDTLDSLVNNDKYPGALAAVRGADGRTRDYTAGVADVKTGARVPVNGQVRIASNTKMFVATVVLQLVGEGKIGLDEPVETYLPGLVRGEGIDGRKITVRQILQHTSGLADYDVELAGQDYSKVQHRYFEARELLDVVLAQKPLFAPGTGWSYSNGNYVLAGLIIQKVTGRPVGEEITKRIIDRIGLRHTYWPGQGDQTIREPHPHGYFPSADGSLADVTEQDPSMAGAAGQLIGTPRDLNRFMTALLGGELLKPQQLKQMKTTVVADDFTATGGARYGLGLAAFKLSCGGWAWTHGGNAPGYGTSNAVTSKGRAATIAVTSLATSLAAAQNIEAALDTTLCK